MIAFQIKNSIFIIITVFASCILKFIFLLYIYIGLPKLIKADMVKPGATIIDVGITRITDENGKSRLVGDVDYEGQLIVT